MSAVAAIWSGPWGYRLPDGTELIPGETQRDIPEGQAIDDPYWTPVKPTVTNPKPPQEVTTNGSAGISN